MDDEAQNKCCGPVKFWLGFGLILLASAAGVALSAIYVPQPQPQSNDVMNETKEVIPTLSEIRAVGENLTSKGEISVWKKRLATLPSDQVVLVEPSRDENPENAKVNNH